MREAFLRDTHTDDRCCAQKVLWDALLVLLRGGVKATKVACSFVQCYCGDTGRSVRLILSASAKATVLWHTGACVDLIFPA